MPWAAVRGHGDLADLQRGVHVLTDKIGIPFGWTADSTNHNDSVLLESTLEDGADVPPYRLRRLASRAPRPHPRS